MKLLENYMFEKFVNDYNGSHGEGRRASFTALQAVIFYAHSIDEIAGQAYHIIQDEVFTAYLNEKEINLEMLKLKVKEVE